MKQKKAGILVIIAMAGLIFSTLNCVTYLARAGCGQLSILWRARPIQDVIDDSATSEEVKKKLRHVLVVRNYARDRLNLNLSDSYTKFSALDRDAVAWNVTASRELYFEPKTWWFPIVGTVPYLGYFDKKSAEEKEEELKKEGYDTKLDEVAAYSTLGWFDDPLLSPQLQMSEWYLTGLVIHEAAHATVWFPGDVDFNESFASFVEEKGMMQYYRETNRELFEKLTAYRVEQKIVSEEMRKTAHALDELYRSSESNAKKRAEKSRLIEELRKRVTDLGSSFKVIRTDRFRERILNNAVFLSFLRYESGQDYFEKEFEACRSDWPCFYSKMKTLINLSATDRKKLLGRGGP